MNIDQVWNYAVRSLLRQPVIESRNGPMKEIVGYSTTIDMRHNWLWDEVRGAKSWYAAAELLWYLSATCDASMITHYAPSYVNYTEEGMAYGAYGPRIMPYLPAIIADLQRKNSRQTVCTIWEPQDLGNIGQTRDLPCTLSLQWILRDALDVIVTMRSNDVWLGMPYDIYCFGEMSKLLAAHLGVKPGMIYHRVGSLHLYERNFSSAAEIGHNSLTEHSPREQEYFPTDLVLSDPICDAERLMRERQIFEPPLGVSPAVTEILRCLAYKNGLPRHEDLDRRL